MLFYAFIKLTHIFIYPFAHSSIMAKRKVNLSIDEEVLKVSKHKAIDLDISFSQYVENLLKG